MDRTLIETYVLYRINPENDEKNDSFFASSFGFSLKELRKEKRLNKGWGKEVLTKRRERYAEHIVGIDKALFKAAKCGDTKAADLLYRRFDSWNPKIVEQTNNFYSFSELVKRIHTKEPAAKRELPHEGDS